MVEPFLAEYFWAKVILAAVIGGIALHWRARRRLKALDQQIDAILETLSEGVVCYDADMRLQRCNSQFREIYALTAPALRKGETLRDILRYGVQAGQWPEAIGREEAWIEERLAVQCDPSLEMVTKVGADRWVVVRNRPWTDGGAIGIRADISAFQNAKIKSEQTAEKLQKTNDRLNATLE